MTRPFTRPFILTLPLALAAAGLLLAACGGFATAPEVQVTAPVDGETIGEQPAAETPGDSAPQPADEPADEPTDAPAPATDQQDESVAGGDELVVFAAASLTDAFDALADAFEAQNPGVTVVRNYASSLQLATQLVEGAQADVFASANERQMASAIEAGRIEGATATFAQNRLTIIVPAGNPGGVTSVAGLAQEGVTFVTAVPGAPIREYTNEMFEQMAADPTFGMTFVDAVYANLVSEETSVRQIVARIALGEADAGVVYESDVTPDVAEDIEQIEIPEEYNVIAAYPIGLIADAPHPELGEAFINFVLSDEGQAILAEWGFEPTSGG